MLEMKKGDKVILKGFTGIKLGLFEVAAVTKKTITVMKKNGEEMIFDRKTGKQVNVEEGKERYANSIMEDDGSYVAPTTRKKTKKVAKKATKKVVEVEDEDEEEEEEEKPVKAKKAKKPAKKAKKVVEEEDDDDDYEEIDYEDDDE